MSSIPYETPNIQPDLGFANQAGGMKAMGIVLIVLGAFAGCFAAFTPIALVVPQPAGGMRPMARDVLMGAGMYAIAAAVLVTSGVGSLRTRRWSRPVILILMGSWALGGLAGLVSWVFVGPDIQQAMMAGANATAGPAAAGGPGGAPAAPVLPAGMAQTIGVVTVIMLIVFGVLLPGGFFWFYVRRNVQQTVDYFDARPAWTDRCPTPVLAVSAWLMLMSLFTLSFCLWGVFPWFGRLISGPMAIAALAAVAVLLAVLAVGTYRLSMAAWTATLLLVFGYAVNSYVTFSRVDPLEMHRLSGTPPEMIRMMEQMNVTSRAASTTMTLLYAIPAVVYLLWVHKFFRRGQTSTTT